MREVDYVVIGAGSAGCVLAHRLSADPGTSVVVLEAGGDDRPLHEPRQFMSNVYIHVPAGFARTLGDPRVTWGYHTEADEAGRVHRMPRGKVFGGSSSINGMIYVRGLPHDYDGWRQLGLNGWAWSDVLPYFLKAESHTDAASSLAGAGQGGPLRISETPEKSELTRAMLTAFVEAGVPHSADLNGEEREGGLHIRHRRALTIARPGDVQDHPPIPDGVDRLRDHVQNVDLRRDHLDERRVDVVGTVGPEALCQVLHLIGDDDGRARHGYAVVQRGEHALVVHPHLIADLNDRIDRQAHVS